MLAAADKISSGDLGFDLLFDVLSSKVCSQPLIKPKAKNGKTNNLWAIFLSIAISMKYVYLESSNAWRIAQT